MTADERIEQLLNRFGQTIEDLPNPKSNKYSTYDWRTKRNLANAAIKWDEKDDDWDVVRDYACHLCDIIDRMEIALETATRLMCCNNCYWAGYCGENCNAFRIKDDENN